MLPYSIAQIAGAFAASALVFATYREALSAFDGGMRMVEGATATAGIFATYPQPYPVDRRRLRRPGGRHDAADGRRAGGHRSKERRRRRPGSPARSSACSSSRSASRSASTPATRSTRRATSVRACSRSWRAGARACSPPAADGGGCRSSRRSSARFSARGCMTRSSTSITSRPRPARMSKFVLALDQGTTSSRAIVFDRSGKAVSSAQQEFPQIFPGPGHVEHDPEGDLVDAAARPRRKRSRAPASARSTSPRSASPTSARRRCCGRRRPASRSPTRSCGRAASPRRSAID